MPQFCAVLNCGSNSLRDKISFYRFPSETDSARINVAKKERRESWIKALRRSDLTESKLKNQRICERHFVSGKPAALEEKDSPDWVPTQHLGPVDTPIPNTFNETPSEDNNKPQVSPIIYLEHNYCSLSPAMTSVMSPLLVQSTTSPTTPTAEDIAVPSCSFTREEVSSRPTVESVATDTPLTPKEDLPSSSIIDRVEVKVEESNGEKPEEDLPPSMEDPQNHIDLYQVDVKTEENVVTDEPIKEKEQTMVPEVIPDNQQDEKVVKPEQPIEDTLPEIKVKEEQKTETESPTKGGNDQEEDYVTRCICGFQHDDGYMICCDKCMVWQHVDCMEIERGNIPEEYLCEKCKPRKVDRAYAISLQRSKKKLFDEMLKEAANQQIPPTSSDQSNSEGETIKAGSGRKKSERRDSVAAKRKKAIKPPSVVKKKRQISKREVKLSKRVDSPVEFESLYDGTDNLRTWIDSYEEAITNHYSPELRATMGVLKNDSLHTPARLVGAHSSRPKSKVCFITSSVRKILLATSNISPNQPILEIRGKYMLSKSGGPSPPPGRRKEEYVFHHRLLGPGTMVTDVQVDASTYGNNARFVRSSCSPNAEIQHCIEKGTLHLYLVSTTVIEAKKEITLPHRPGASCALGDKCSLLSGKRRSRKQILTERTVSKETTMNNNNYKDFPPRKRSFSSDRTVAAKTIKSSVPTRASQDHFSKVTRGKVTLRSAITNQVRRTESKSGLFSTKKP